MPHPLPDDWYKLPKYAVWLASAGGALLVLVTFFDNRLFERWFRPNLYLLRAAYATALIGLAAWALWFVVAVMAYVFRV